MLRDRELKAPGLLTHLVREPDKGSSPVDNNHLHCGKTLQLIHKNSQEPVGGDEPAFTTNPLIAARSWAVDLLLWVAAVAHKVDVTRPRRHYLHRCHFTLAKSGKDSHHAI